MSALEYVSEVEKKTVLSGSHLENLQIRWLQ